MEKPEDCSSTESEQARSPDELKQLQPLIDAIASFIARQAIKEWEVRARRFSSPEEGEC